MSIFGIFVEKYGKMSEVPGGVPFITRPPPISYLIIRAFLWAKRYQIKEGLIIDPSIGSLSVVPSNKNIPFDFLFRIMRRIRTHGRKELSSASLSCFGMWKKNSGTQQQQQRQRQRRSSLLVSYRCSFVIVGCILVIILGTTTTTRRTTTAVTAFVEVTSTGLRRRRGRPATSIINSSRRRRNSTATTATATTAVTAAWRPSSVSLLGEELSLDVDDNNGPNATNDDVLPVQHQQQCKKQRGRISAADTNTAMVSRRHVFVTGGMVWSGIVSAVALGSFGAGRDGEGGATLAAHAYYKIEAIEAEETTIYRMAQNVASIKSTASSSRSLASASPIRVLWLGPGDFQERTGMVRNGVYKDLFRPGVEVTALDLVAPSPAALFKAQQYARTVGHYTLHFQQGDATHLAQYYAPETFDVVVDSLFLCQDFEPRQVVDGIYRVLKDHGRFGFYEHIDYVDTMIVDHVFGKDRGAVITLQSSPDVTNIHAGVVVKTKQ